MTPTPSPVLSAELEKEFNEKFENDVFYGVATFFKHENGDLDREEGQKVVKNLKQFIAHAVSEERKSVIAEVVRWMRIENDVSIVHKEEWDEFVKELLSERRESHE